MTLGSHKLTVLVTSTALIGAAAAGPAAVASAHSAHPASATPPCTKAALTAGLTRGSGAVKDAKIMPKGFGCSGSWAYAGVAVGSGKTEYDAVAVFQAKHGEWVAVNRAKPCKTHAVPQKIYKPACTTS